jgi:hypothetical protein
VILPIMKRSPDKSRSWLSSWGLYPSAFYFFWELGVIILIFASITLSDWGTRLIHWLAH